jgi:hypothetical protein
MVPQAMAELHEELEAFPYPQIPNDERVFNLLVRETFKVCNNYALSRDGDPKKRKREALGSECGFCNEAMLDSSEMELHHTFYDGRPPLAVHTACHKHHQPH